MPDDIKFTKENIVSSNEPVGKKKIKFAQKSFVACLNAIKRKINELEMERAVQQYETQYSKLENRVEDLAKRRIPLDEKAIASHVQYLSSIAVKIVKYDLADKRLEQTSKPKPIKVNKTFAERVKAKFIAIAVNRVESNLLAEKMSEAYKKQSETLMEELKHTTSVKDTSFSKFSDVHNFTQANNQEENTNNAPKTAVNNASSLFANMQTNVPEVSEVQPVVEEIQNTNTQVASTEFQMPDYADFLKSNSAYSQSVQRVFELPPAGSRNIESNMASINTSPVFETPEFEKVKEPVYSDEYVLPKREVITPPVQPSSSYIESAQQFSKQLYNETSNNQPVISDYNNLSDEQLLAMAKKLTEMVEERKTEKIVREQQEREEFERVSAFHRDYFDYSPDDYEKIISRERAAESERRIRTEAFAALMNGRLSFDEIENYFAKGIITVEQISEKLQDPNLSYAQIGNLSMANGIGIKMKMEAKQQQSKTR